MAEQDAGDRRAQEPDRSRRRPTLLGLALIAGPGVGGLVWFVVDQYVADEARFAAYPLLVAGAALVGGVWLIFGDRARTAAVVSGGLLAAVGTLYPVIQDSDDPPTPPPPQSSTTPLPSSTEPPPASAGPSTPADSSAEPAPCTQLASVGVVQTSRGPDQRHVAEVTYTVDDARDPFVQITGRLVGQLGPTEGFYVVKTGNPATHDATPNRYPGTSGYFLSDEIVPGSSGCWEYERTRLGYACVGGIEFRFSFALIPDAAARPLLDERLTRGVEGLPEQIVLDNPNVEILGYIDVPTTPHPTCPA